MGGLTLLQNNCIFVIQKHTHRVKLFKDTIKVKLEGQYFEWGLN